MSDSSVQGFAVCGSCLAAECECAARAAAMTAASRAVAARVAAAAAQPQPIADELDWLTDLRRAHGLPSDPRVEIELGGVEPPDNCRVCDKPVDLSDEELYGASRRKTCRACLRERDTERRKRELAATIPPRYDWATLDAPLLPSRLACGLPAPERVEEVLRSQRVVFVGKAGSGKTSLAVALLREVARRGADAMFVQAYRLATARARHPLGHGEPPLLEAAMAATVLLVDDIGNERQTELSDVRATIFERHDYERTIWVTTALSSAELASMYGGGFVRRLTERAAVVQCAPLKPGAPR